MVKRFYAELAVEHTGGKWIRHEDYFALQTALREALERWTELHSDFVAEDKVPNRVQQLRAQFLDDK